MQRVLEGIQAAAEVGMKIKINMVVQKEKRTGHFADGNILRKISIFFVLLSIWMLEIIMVGI